MNNVISFYVNKFSHIERKMLNKSRFFINFISNIFSLLKFQTYNCIYKYFRSYFCIFIILATSILPIQIFLFNCEFECSLFICKICKSIKAHKLKQSNYSFKIKTRIASSIVAKMSYNKFKCSYTYIHYTKVKMSPIIP